MLSRDLEHPPSYSVTGSSLSIMSQRVSYCFNLKGPSMTLNRACSSSMTALHLTCSAIHNRECNRAIIAGANLILSPKNQILSSDLGIVLSSGRCYTFDTAANRYYRAKGAASLYIKRLGDAFKD